MSAVGQIVPCPAITHYDHCTAPSCIAHRETSHDGCDFCGGSKFVRITVDQGDYMECEPAPSEAGRGQ